MSEKLKDIKSTAADAVEIIRELGTPEVQSSLEKIRETAKVVKEVMDSLKDQAMVTNIENIRKTAESFERSSARMESAVAEIKSSGVLDEVKGAVGSARGAIDSLGRGDGMGDTVGSVKELVRSLSALIDEFRLTLASSKATGTVRDFEQTVRQAREIFPEEPKQ